MTAERHEADGGLDAPGGPAADRELPQGVEGLALTTDVVEIPGVDPADPPTELLPGALWQGGMPVDFDWVRGNDIDVLVDVADADTYPPPRAYEGLVYVKCPLVDAEALPDLGALRGMAQLVASFVRDERRVLVHCTFGRNRSGLLVSLVVREVLGLDGPAALAHVQERRPRAVNNETFAQWLRSLPAPESCC